MEKLKLNKEIIKHSFWWWILVIIAVIFFYNLFFNDTEEYTSCMNDCAYEENSCIYDNMDYDSNGNDYILGDEALSCSDDLEYCLSSCESDYG